MFLVDTVKHLLLLFADPQPPIMDARGYWDLAAAIRAGDWWWQNDPIAFRTPGYPAFLALFQSSLGKYAMMSAIGFQHICVMTTSITTAWVCGRITKSGRATIAAYGLSIICISRGWSANLLLTETVFTLLLTLLLAADIYYREHASTKRALIVGVILGVTTLVRPVTSLFWVPLTLSWLLFRPVDLSRWRRCRHAAVMVSVSFLLLVPWYARNLSTFGEPFLTSFLGRNIWTVTFQDGSGAGLALPKTDAAADLLERVQSVDAMVDLKNTWDVSNALRRTGLNDHETDKLMVRTCLAANRAEPMIVCYKAVRRSVNFWRCVANPIPRHIPTEATDSLSQVRWNSLFMARLVHTLTDHSPSRSLRMNELLLLSVLCGTLILMSESRLRTNGLIFGLTLAYFTLITAAVEIPTYRYRMVVEPVTIMIVVCGYASVFRRVRRSVGSV
jgi:hypothetical protein